MKKEELAAKWQKLREKDAHIRIRDAARRLGVSEMELLVTRDGVTALSPEFQAIMDEAGSLGRVMALTRNEACVHERKGQYDNISAKGGSGLVVGPDIDLRIFYGHWAHAFHVIDDVRGATRHSLQFFDKYGQAIHKIFQLESPEPFAKILSRFRASNAEHTVQPAPDATPLEERLKKDIDQNAFLEDWGALQDTHEFFGMLARYDLHRLHALQMAEGRYSSLLPKSAISELLFRAAETGQEIMVFVGNPGMIQIHTGSISNVRPLEAWMNVLDSDFNLHLRTDLIDRAYLVEKPTRDGTVTSIEVFDSAGDLIVQFFGKRKPGIPEQESWRALAHSLVEKAA